MTLIRALMSNRWAQGAALVAAMLLLVFALDRCARYAMSSMQESATQAGAAQQQASDLQSTISRTKEASDAAETMRRDPDARHAECLRHARNPDDC